MAGAVRHLPTRAGGAGLHRYDGGIRPAGRATARWSRRGTVVVRGAAGHRPQATPSFHRRGAGHRQPGSGVRRFCVAAHRLGRRTRGPGYSDDHAANGCARCLDGLPLSPALAVAAGVAAVLPRFGRVARLRRAWRLFRPHSGRTLNGAGGAGGGRARSLARTAAGTRSSCPRPTPPIVLC